MVLRHTGRMISIAVLGALALSGLAAQPGLAKLLVPMDLEQTDHLRAYGVAYRALLRGENVEWLLNYRGGSFLLEDVESNERECLLAGVVFQEAGGSVISQIYDTIEGENMEVVLLEKAPRICVYTPPSAQPWDDAVTMALDYAEIPFAKVFDKEVLDGALSEYDWLHLHHEDFTGQYGKFFASYHSASWYIEEQRQAEAAATAAGFPTVWEHKQAVVRRIKEYVARGGFLFAMCSATDTYEIALAAQGVDIVDLPFDGDRPDPGAQQRLDFDNCFAFENFSLVMDPMVYEFSDVDMTESANRRGQAADFFTLFDFSAKEDPVPTMLTQDHVNVVPGFMGQTTSFNKRLLKKSVIMLAQAQGTDEVRYIHGNFGQGTFTFYGGHDPEDYQHRVGDPPTELRLHKNSPGYRLILNNILFPAAEKKERKT